MYLCCNYLFHALQPLKAHSSTAFLLVPTMNVKTICRNSNMQVYCIIYVSGQWGCVMLLLYANIVCSLGASTKLKTHPKPKNLFVAEQHPTSFQPYFIEVDTALHWCSMFLCSAVYVLSMTWLGPGDLPRCHQHKGTCSYREFGKHPVELTKFSIPKGHE